MKYKLLYCIILIGLIIVCLFTIPFNKYNKEIVKAISPSNRVITVTNTDTLPSFYYKTAKQGIEEALIYYEIKNLEIVYAQAILETGNFTSNLCIKHNNLFGLYDSKNHTYFKYNHWVESVKDYKNKIQNRYKEGENYYHFLKRIKYATATNYISTLKQIVNDQKRSNRFNQDTP